MKLTHQQRDYLRKIGRKGGRRRAQALTAAQRSEQARAAVLARWAKVKAGS